MNTHLHKVKNLLRSLSFISVLCLSLIITVKAADGVLSVNSISVVKGSAIANTLYVDGWQWLFDITLPANEPTLRMRFSDWFNGTSTIASGDNMRYYSQYSINASTSLSAALISGASSTYGDILIFATSTDLDLLTDGIQTRVMVEAKVPLGSSGSNYHSTYGLKSLPVNVETLVDFPSGRTDSPASYSLSGGSGNNVIWHKNINISNGSAKIFGMTLKKTGSANDTTFSNFILKIDGVAIANASALNASHDVVFDLSASPYLLTPGLKSVDVSTTLDTASVGRNFRFSLQSSSDISVEDALVPGVPLTVTSNLGGIANNLSSGNISFNSLILVSATNNKLNNSVISGGSGVVIASYTMRAYNESAVINNLTFSPAMSSMVTTDSTTNNLSNVGLYVNGNRVGTSQTIISGSNFTFSGLSADFIVGSEASTTVEIRADIKTVNGIAYSSGNIKVDMLAAIDNASGAASGGVRSTTYLAGQTMTVAEHGVQLIAASFSPTVMSTNTTGYKIGSYTISAGNADGVTVSTAYVTLSGSIVNNNNINNLVIKNGNNVLGVYGSIFAGISSIFPMGLSIATSSSITLDLYVDVLGSAISGESLSSNMYIFGQTSSSLVTVTSPIVNGPNITLP